MAIEQNREIMAVPGSPLDPRHRGTNQLLRDGAVLIETADDVSAALGACAPVARRRPARADGDAQDRIGLDLVRAAAAPAETLPAPSAGSLQDRICERLGTEPLLVDELIRQCHAHSSEMQHALFELEMEGRIQRHPGNRVSLASS
jgi:DNA processing protein